MKKKVALLLFDDVEVLDFAGPFEVFSVTNELNDYSLLDIRTLSPDGRQIVARNGLTVVPEGAIAEAPAADILILPGGIGTKKLLENEEVTDWVRRITESAELVLSVCTGARLLAKAGLLDGLRMTTHHEAFDELAALAPRAEVDRGSRFVDTGKVITSAGISAGIDMCLHVVGKLYGSEVAERTAEYMEYSRRAT